jgi:hypothetical protein
MKGQWIGNYTGSTAGGTIIVDADELPSQYRGVAYLLESDGRLPSAAAFFKTMKQGHRIQFSHRPDSGD